MGYTAGAVPWNQVTPMEAKQRFVSLAATGRFTPTELGADSQVSRKTGHKRLQRYRQFGALALHVSTPSSFFWFGSFLTFDLGC